MNQKERDKYQLVPGKGTLAQRLRAQKEARESAIREGPVRPDPPHSQTKAVITQTTHDRSPSGHTWPDPARGTVKKSYPDGPRSLRGTMMHRAPKTLRGTSVVPDKPDTST